MPLQWLALSTWVPLARGRPSQSLPPLSHGLVSGFRTHTLLSLTNFLCKDLISKQRHILRFRVDIGVTPFNPGYLRWHSALLCLALHYAAVFPITSLHSTPVQELLRDPPEHSRHAELL